MTRIYVLTLLLASNVINAVNLQDLTECKVALVHQDGIFSVIDDAGEHSIQNCFVDKELRNRSSEEMLGFLQNNNYLTVSKMSDGEYAVHGHGRLPGGGLGGATVGVAVGQFLGNIVVFTGIGIASAGAGAAAFCVGGPVAASIAAGATAKSLTATVVPLAQPFIHSIAIGCAVVGGVATGPV